MPEKRTLTALSKELIDNPFFPLLFIAEFIKQIVQQGPFIVEHGALAVVCVLLWVLSDAIDVDTDDIIGGDEES